MKTVFLAVTALALAGCTITIHVDHGQTATPVAKPASDGYEYSVTHNPEAARAFGWEVVGILPDGRAKVRRKPGRYVEAAK